MEYAVASLTIGCYKWWTKSARFRYPRVTAIFDTRIQIPEAALVRLRSLRITTPYSFLLCSIDWIRSFTLAAMSKEIID